MKEETEATLIAAAAGVIGTLLGSVVGALAAWRAASSTNTIQKQIADSNANLQSELAASNVTFQRKLVEDTQRSQRHATIEAMILKLSEFAIQHPTLEKDAYCQTYPNCPGDINGKERYENYCVYVFNTLGAVWDFCGGDRDKIDKIVGAEELIRRHYRCWVADTDNLSHDEGFQQYVQGMINDLRKRGKSYETICAVD